LNKNLGKENISKPTIGNCNLHDYFADGDSDHYLVAAKVRERWAVNEQSAQNFDVERFNLRKLSELEFRKQYQMKISNRFAALENLNDSEDINLAWENIKQDIQTSAKDSLGLSIRTETP
jgi:hypothetical protein